MSDIETTGGEEVEARERARITRRAAIQKAALAAGAVWVAPAIIDSLASPAAAVTAPKGSCFKGYLEMLDCTFVANDPTSGCAVPSAVCSPTDPPLGIATYLQAIGCPPVNAAGGTVTVQVKPGYSCRIIAASAYVQTDNLTTSERSACRTATSDGKVGTGNNKTTFTGFGTTSLTITPNGGSGTDNWDTDGTAAQRSTIGIVIQCP